MRQALIRPEYNTQDQYYDTGCFQAIAKSSLFENVTFMVIALNALWIAVDCDYNDAQLLIDAHLVFQVVENVFCTFFFFELLIRFMAFRKKRFCLKDFWFVFDFLLVCTMVIETWVFTLVMMFAEDPDAINSSVGSWSILRLVRLVKILRMARVARLLRMIPELVVILRGMNAAFRSVGFFILLTVIILYVFGVGFTQAAKSTELGSSVFRSVPSAMNYLLLEGMLPLYSPIVNTCTEVHPAYWPAIMIFILLASVTVMNMLIGVLVEVVRTVAATEKEGMTVAHVTHQLKEVMEAFQTGGTPAPARQSKFARSVTRPFMNKSKSREQEAADIFAGSLGRSDFDKFLMQPDVAVIIQDVGVDVMGLIDMADMIYEDKDKEGKGLSFVDFIDVVLNMRGTNPSTVKDVKQQIRVMKNAMKESSFTLRKHISEDMDTFRLEVLEQLIEIRKSQLGSDAGSDVGEMTHALSEFARSRMSVGYPGLVSSGPSGHILAEDEDDTLGLD